MNGNKGKPSSTMFDPGVACSAGRCKGKVQEPFACPVNLDEERDAEASSRPKNVARTSVERRDDANLKRPPKSPPNLAYHYSWGASRSLSSASVPRKQKDADNGTRAAVDRLYDVNRKRAPKTPPNSAFRPSMGVLGSRSSCAVPRKKEDEEELSFPFVVDKHPTPRIVAQVPNRSINNTTGVSSSLSKMMASRNNDSGHQTNEVDGQNLAFFAEIAHPKQYSAPTSRPKTISRPPIVNTPLGLAVLLNYDGYRPQNTYSDIAHRGVTITTQLGLANSIQRSTMNTMQSNQQSQPEAVSSNLHQLGTNETTGRRFQRWLQEEDRTLRYAISEEGGRPPHNWNRIAHKYFKNSRSALQCKSRWTKSLKPGIVRGAWTPEEDASILKYRQMGLKWSQIAKFLPGRITEHISDRYNNVLDPHLKKTPWTPGEDRVLFREQRRIGNKWTQISRLIPGRSENSVKNRWHNLKVTRERRMRQEAKHMRQNAKQLECRTILNGDNMEQKCLLEKRLRLLQLEMAKKSSIPGSDGNGVAMATEQKQLQDQIQLLQLGRLQFSSTPPKCAPKEVIEILDDDDDD